MLRKCNICGLKAYTEQDLSSFCSGQRCKFGKKNLCKSCNSSLYKDRHKVVRDNNRKKIKEYLGGEYRCQDCGLVHDYLPLFDWHHRDPSKKENQISRIMTNSWKYVKKEIDKCDFLCANCHRLRHKGEQ